MVFSLELYQFFFLFSNFWSDGEILAWVFLSKWSWEDGYSELIVSTLFWMGPNENFLNLSWYPPLNFINYSSCFSKLWSDEKILAWDFISKWSSEDGCSEVIVNTPFWKCSDGNRFYYMCCFSLKYINYSSGCSKNWLDG